MCGIDASSATVTAARTISASMSATTGGSWDSLPARFVPPAHLCLLRGTFSHRSLQQRTGGFDQNGRLERLAQHGIRPDALDLGFVQLLERAQSNDHARVPVPRADFDVLAQLVTRTLGHDGVRQNQVGIDVFEANQRGIAVANGHDFEAFFAEDPFAHALGVRAVVSQQNAAHLPDDCGAEFPFWAGTAAGTFFFFFFSFFFFPAGTVWFEGSGCICTAAGCAPTGATGAGAPGAPS